MTTPDKSTDSVAQAIGIDAMEIERRKEFLGFYEADRQLLVGLHPQLERAREAFVDDFYAHLRRFAELDTFISDENSLKQLKKTQSDYFKRLTTGDYGTEYVLNRLRVGLAHQRTGLDPKWYIGAYGKYLVGLLPECWSLLHDNPQEFLDAYSALLKLVLLDIGLAIDTYIYADRLTILGLEQYADDILARFPSGLTVCDTSLKVMRTNLAFCELLHLASSDDAVGRNIDDLLPIAGLRGRALDALATETKLHGIETALGGKPIRLSLSGLRLAEGKDTWLLVVVEDISAEHELRTRARAREAEAHYHELVQGLEAIVWEADADTLRVNFVSRYAETVLGHPVARWLDEPDFWASVIFPEDLDRVITQYHDVIERGYGGVLDYRAVTADGHIVWLHDVVNVVRDEDGRVQTLRGVMIDITKRIDAENSLKLFRTLIDRSSDSIAVIDPKTGKFLDVNERGCADLGYARDELLNLRVFDIDPTLNQSQWPDQSEQLRELHFRTWESMHRRKDGSTFAAEVSVKYIEIDREYLVAVVRDITERKRTQDHLNFLAHHDPLTGLPNRNLLRDRLRQTLIAAARYGHVVGVLFFDLDRFKVINDSLGHSVGDRLLQAVAGRLRDCVRRGDTVARIGGDEFVMILADITRPQDAAVIASKILEGFSQPFLLNDLEASGAREFLLDTSIGISLSPNDGEDPDSLLKNADSAMYRAKERGGNRYHFFTPEMNARARQRLSLESALRSALERQEFRVHYQPQISLTTRRLIGAEALLRWSSPTRGCVAPAHFIPVLEETGLIVPVGEWVLREACMLASNWAKESHTPLRLAVNVSARQLQDGNFTETIAKVIADSRINATNLELEITESAVMRHFDACRKTLDGIRGLGVRIAMDDFGTGYSSLSQLKRLPIDTVKIDQYFVRDMPTDENDTAIVQAIIAMSSALHLSVVAEGVETEEQRVFLQKHGCDAAQGYLFSRPLLADEMTSLVERTL